MADLTIITNSVPRSLITLADLPQALQADFDYIEGDEQYSPRIFMYKGNAYDVNEFVRVASGSAYPGKVKWDGIQSDSYFSGVLVKYTNDFEDVIVGRYYS